MILARHKRRGIGDWEAVYIDEAVRNCVAFLFSDVVDPPFGVRERRPMGTAFLVAIQHAGDLGSVYAVTARHIIDGTRQLGNLRIRLNRKGRGYDDYLAPHDTWTCHPTTDVAVAPFGGVPLDDTDVQFLPFEFLATDGFIERAEISEGDEVYFTGLFTQHVGSTRSQPVLRFGNISLMPREPILAKIDPAPNAAPVEIDAYLVEARSWGGQSGSPAFLHFHLWRPVNADDGIGDIRPRLLGLVHGHYSIPQDVNLMGDTTARGNVPVNAGMAIVIPAQKIIDTLMMDELVKERDERVKEHKNKNQSVPEPDLTTTSESEFERFQNLAKKLVRVPKEEIDEKRKDES
jgi:hypothetical protein